jgi:hypothetical protein
MKNINVGISVRLYSNHGTERRGRVVNTPTSYPVGKVK